MKKRYKEKIKLKNKTKVVLTILLLILGVFIYSKAGAIGDLAQTHRGYQFVCIGVWFWLLTGQLITLSFIWEN